MAKPRANRTRKPRALSQMETAMWLHNIGFRQPRRQTTVLMLAGLLLFALGTPATGSSPKSWPNTFPGASPSAPAYAAPPYFAKDKGQPPPNLSPEEKGRMQRQYREWQTLPPDQKDAMRRRMDEWNRTTHGGTGLLHNMSAPPRSIVVVNPLRPAVPRRKKGEPPRAGPAPRATDRREGPGAGLSGLDPTPDALPCASPPPCP